MIMHASTSGGTLSTLLEQQTANRLVRKAALTEQDPALPGRVAKNYDYVFFRFLPDGSTNLPPVGTKWYITVHAEADLAKTAGDQPPPNFFTLMIEPVSGASKILRPGAG
jgi:hypothetical protein